MRGLFAVIAALAVGYLLVDRLHEAPSPLPSNRSIDQSPVATHVASRPGVHHPSETLAVINDPLIQPIDLPSTSTAQPFASRPSFDVGSLATFHPHGEQVCASGCAASRHPTKQLSTAKFASLVQSYASESIGDAGPALDELLYFGRQSAQLLEHDTRCGLDPLRFAILDNELARDHAIVELRVVDSTDKLRATLPPTKVPLDRRHEFELHTSNLQPMIASGTVKRVGRDYAWTRL